MPTFYPSCVVNLRLRFDESLHIQPEQPIASTETTVGESAAPADGVGEPLIIRRGDQNATFIQNRIPIRASVELPGYRQAGQFNLEFAFRDLPIDPRTVRAAAVDIHLGAVDAADFARGMTGQPIDGWRPSVLRTTINDEGDPNLGTLVMTGTVDRWAARHDDSGSIVTLEGRDMRGILLDTPLTNNPAQQQFILEELDLSQPIDTLIATLLSYNPLFADFIVTTVPEEWPNGVVPVVGDASIVPRHRRGANGRRRGGRATPNASGGSLNFWDLICRFCYLVGAIPYFIGTELRIRPVRSIYEQQRAGGPLNPTPFRGGEPRSQDAQANTEIDPPLRYRRLVYGRDIEELTFERSMGGVWSRPHTFVCVSVNNDSTERGRARVIEGRWPPVEATRARRQTASPGSGPAQENVFYIPAPGNTSQERLVEMARALYEEAARQEIGGSCRTRNLASFGGDNQDPDLLRLKPGDAIEFLVDARNLSSRSPLISALTDHYRNGFEEQVALITERLGDENLARVIVATSRGIIQEVPNFFRVSRVKFDWSAQGVTIDFDFQNFVQALFDVPRQTDQSSEGTAQRQFTRRRGGGSGGT